MFSFFFFVKITIQSVITEEISTKVMTQRALFVKKEKGICHMKIYLIQFKNQKKEQS